VGGINGGLTRDYLRWRAAYVPDFYTIPFEVRSLPGQKPEDILREVQRVLDGLKADDPDLKIEVELPPATYRKPWRGKKHLQPGLDIPVEDDIVQAVRRHHVEVIGKEPDAIGTQDPGSYAWTDAGHLFQAGCKPIIYGPTRNGATYVELEKLLSCTRVLALSAVDICNWDWSRRD
jgi:acetylornithine deacetylase/succinyl-diaminopimelate desuccinylase-like protein